MGLPVNRSRKRAVELNQSGLRMPTPEEIRRAVLNPSKVSEFDGMLIKMAMSEVARQRIAAQINGQKTEVFDKKMEILRKKA